MSSPYVWVVQSRGGAMICGFTKEKQVVSWFKMVPGFNNFQLFRLVCDPADGVASEVVELDPDQLVRDLG